MYFGERSFLKLLPHISSYLDEAHARYADYMVYMHEPVCV